MRQMKKRLWRLETLLTALWNDRNLEVPIYCDIFCDNLEQIHKIWVNSLWAPSLPGLPRFVLKHEVVLASFFQQWEWVFHNKRNQHVLQEDAEEEAEEVWSAISSISMIKHNPVCSSMAVPGDLRNGKSRVIHTTTHNYTMVGNDLTSPHRARQTILFHSHVSATVMLSCNCTYQKVYSHIFGENSVYTFVCSA